MSSPDDALRLLCAGDPWSLDRRTEHLLPLLADAMATDWRPSLGGLSDARRARVGYLLSVVSDSLDRGVAARWAAWLAVLRREAVAAAPTDTADDVAREWGLAGGLDVPRIRRVLRLRLA